MTTNLLAAAGQFWTAARRNLAQNAAGFLLGLIPALVVALHVWRVTR